MEKQDAAMDSRLPAFICATMSSRSVLLMLLINSIYVKQSPDCVSIGDQALFTQRGSSIILCFALWLLVVFIENIRPHSIGQMKQNSFVSFQETDI